MKERLSASVDTHLIEAAESAVAAGRAPTLSAWISEAMRRQIDHDRRMEALDEFLSAYESEHGVITEGEIAEAERWARERAVVVRGREHAKRNAQRKKRSG